MSENNSMPLYKNSAADTAERVKDLLQRMTLKEKAGQLIQPPEGWKSWVKADGRIEVSGRYKEWISEFGIGAIYGVFRACPWTGVDFSSGLNAVEGAIAANELQRYAVENTRLGIPLLFSEEGVHGHLSLGSTVFPVQLNMASTWNLELVKKASAAAALEARTQGAHILYGPVLDLARDPRWSRVEETPGEDPYLAGSIGVAVVEGMQGKSLKEGCTVICTLKHFAGYGSPEGGRNCGPVHAGERELREVFLPPFKRAVLAGARSVMSSYNEIDGIPCTGSRRLLTEILRNEWGFEGFVVSDGTAIDCLHKMHKVAENLESAAIMALMSGVDLSLWDEAYLYLVNAVESGKVSIEYIDAAVSRILYCKFSLGLFDEPYIDTGRAAPVKRCTEHRNLALRTAQESIILLKNRNRVLPLSKDIRSIAVIGPNADNIFNQLGDYTAPQKEEDIITVLKGISSKVSRDTEIHYAKGCGVNSGNAEGILDAVTAARQSDMAVIVLGGSSARSTNARFAGNGEVIVECGFSEDMESGEGCDRADLELGGIQLKLFEEIHALGIPVIVVLIKGRPLCINSITGKADAILDAGYPGEQGGSAVADILFGDCNPSGKLAISVPKSVGQLPVYYNRKPTGFKEYLTMDSEPFYPFGYGLSYTDFVYSDLKLFPEKIKPGEYAEVSIKLVNTGSLAGQEVVQLYIGDDISSVTRPVKELKKFEKVFLEPGECKKVTFQIGWEELALIGSDMVETVEPGSFTVMIGSNSKDVLSGVLIVE